MTARCAFLLAFLFASFSVPAVAQQGDELITATDLLRIKQLGAVHASPDGRNVAYTIREIVEKREEEGQYEYRTHLYILPVSSGAPARAMTHGERTASQPHWHPDGDRLAFVRPVDGTSQIFVLPLFGGEAYQLTDFEHGATNPQWSSDGRRILFSAMLSEDELRERTGTAPLWSDERPARAPAPAGAEPDPDGSLAEVRAWLDANSADDAPRVFNRLDLQGELALEPKRRFRHYFVLDTEAPEAEPTMITRGFTSYSGATWMADGFQVIVSGAPESSRHPDRVRDRDLFVVDSNGLNLHVLLDLDGYALSAPTISPDNKRLAFLARDLDDPGYAQTELGLFALDGRTPPELLTLGFDRSLGGVSWSKDTWFLYFLAPSNGGFPLFRLAVEEGRAALPTDTTFTDSLARARAVFARDEIVVRRPRVERMTSTQHGIRSYDLTEATVYYVLTEPLNPYELYASTMAFEQQRRLTTHNVAWLQEKRLSVPEAFTVEQDTLEIDYWVMRPPDGAAGRRAPMLLEIHGGPSAMWGPGEATMWHEFQFMAARGYGVVFGNPRGSGGYGHAFKALNYQDWGDGPASDVLAIATDAARRQRWLDRERQVVTGGSYAGYLTAWIVGHDDRFRAAVAQRGVYDLPTFFGEGRAWRLVPNHFGGFPWEEGARESLLYNSPLTYVEQIRTPLLIIHADQDLRTGVIQSEVLYKSLKALERPVEYVRYPKAGHDLSRTGDPRQRIDRLLRIYEFMERYVGPDASVSSVGGSE